MSFELLPNEILLDLFDYFDSTDLFFTFSGLNSRFNCLIYEEHRLYSFNFISVSKRNFDTICQQYLPVVVDRIIALHFSDSDTTPNQTALFYYYIPSLKHFINLQFLSVAEIRSSDLLIKIINECFHLPCLTHLTLKLHTPQYGQMDFRSILNRIWFLPGLTYCDVHSSIDQQHQLLSAPTNISSSLECVSIDAGYFKWDEIIQLIDCTPYLRRFSINISELSDQIFMPFSFPTLTDLKIITYDKSASGNMFIFLRNTPNLYRLDIDLRRILIDGNQWKEVISNYLPQLKMFRFRMSEMLDSTRNIQERVDELVDSFRNSFWIDEHQWFIRCYVQDKIILYSTSSKTDSYIPNKRFDSITSTYPYKDEREFYNNMNHITDDSFFDQPYPTYVQFGNIEILCLKLPINDQFLSKVPTLNRLRSLTISSHMDIFQSQLQTIFDRASYLNTLFIQQSELLSLQRSLFNYSNVSILHLYLQRNNPRFNEEECMTLTRCPLAGQCESLSIRVKSRESIIDLVKNMIKLRSLNVKYDDQVYKHYSLSENDSEPPDWNRDELVQWLKEHLPSTYRIVRHPSFPKNILIWI